MHYNKVIIYILGLLSSFYVEGGSSFCVGFHNFVLLSLGKRSLDFQTSPDIESIGLDQNVSLLVDLVGDVMQ